MTDTMKEKMQRNQFELLLPVGQKEMALAAIHNGADAIFVGMPKFNARGRSHDFSLEELRELIETCHLYGVKVNIAFNILIFENEQAAAIETLRQVLALQPDALIVQDLGLIQWIRAIAPDQAIHASTQMTVTNELAMNLLKDLRIKRFVLGRENSLKEIRWIAEHATEELEVFVHGALCVSYSGQCFTSENLGGRSANRGQCAQSCRLSYELHVDGQKIQNLDEKYLVSPQDLCGIAEIPELMNLGVKSFKVEGRLKTPEYVASVASSFNQAINSYLQGQALSEVDLRKSMGRMAMAYSRGFFPGWLHGVDHQKLVEGTFNSHRGAYLGTVVGAKSSALQVRMETDLPLEAGDGVLWATGGKETEQGSFVYSVDESSQKGMQKIFWIGIENGKFLTIAEQEAVRGAKFYINHSKSAEHQVYLQSVDRKWQKKVPVRMALQIKLNEPVVASIEDGVNRILLSSEVQVSVAQKKALNREVLADEMQSLGGSVFCLSREEDLQIDLGENLFFPMSEVKKLRQNLLFQLENQRKLQRVSQGGGVTEQSSPIPVTNLVTSKKAEGEDLDSTSKLSILLRDRFQVDQLCQAILENRLQSQEIDSVILDFEFGRDYSDSMEKIRQVGLRVGIATTRILKPQEYQNLKNIHKLNPDIILVRNLGALEYYRSQQKFAGSLWGDFSLNAANSTTAQYLLSKGLERLTLSYDLNSEQVAALLRGSAEFKIQSLLEVTVHQSMPSFHMEHCVFAAFLSEGSSYKDCEKPCEKHQVQLKDQLGHWHRIKPDQECRNTMYNAIAQTALGYVQEWQDLGLRNLRFEALQESGEELIAKMSAYMDFLNKRLDLDSALKKIAAKEVYGLSPGNLSRAHAYQSVKKTFSESKNIR